MRHIPSILLLLALPAVGVSAYLVALRIQQDAAKRGFVSGCKTGVMFVVDAAHIPYPVVDWTSFREGCERDSKTYSLVPAKQ